MQDAGRRGDVLRRPGSETLKSDDRMNSKLSSESFVVSGPSFRSGARPSWCRLKYPFNSAPYLDNHFLRIDTDGSFPDTNCLKWPQSLRFAASRFHYNMRTEHHARPTEDVRLYQSTCMNCVYYVSKFNYSPKAVMHRADHLLNELEF